MASAFVTSVLTSGLEAVANDPDRRALGFSEEDRVSILVEEPLDFDCPRFKPRFKTDLAPFLA
jgi:hypothetical protein